MSNRNQSMDGFVPRRARSELGERHDGRPSNGIAPRKELRSEADLENAPLGRARPGQTLGRSDIDDSLRQLDEAAPPQKMSRRERKRLKKANRTPAQIRRRRLARFLVIAVVIAFVAGAGILAFKALKATGSVLNGNVFDLIQNQPLKQDSNGRSNFLILGTSEDDPGHQGGNLTDSMMVLSVDQKNKNAYMFNVPRDLYVKYGISCLSGDAGKINVYYSCSNSGTDDAAEQDRLTKTQEFVGNILGMNIQYGVHVNYTVMRDLVNAIGGSITVNIEGDNGNGQQPNIGIMDSNFDWKCGANYYTRKKNCPPSGHFIDYQPGPQVLDAEHALYLAQARGDVAPEIGLAQSNFDRERNQQKILMAVREKALSAGTLTNLGAVTGLIDALGNNLRTNIQTNEVRTLMDLAKNIKQSDIKTIDLYSQSNPIFTTGDLPGAGSSVYPKAGEFDYSDLQAFLAKQLSSDPVTREGAVITVLNGSGVTGAAQTVADNIKSKGMIVDEVGNAPRGTYDPITIYEISNDKTATAQKLKDLYGVTPLTTTPPVKVSSTTDFLIIVGNASTSSNSGSSSTSGSN